RDAAGFRVEAPWPVDSPKSTGAAEMSTSTIEALASAWARIAEEAELPADYQGTATPQPLSLINKNHPTRLPYLSRIPSYG
ncbi:hypothetical protein ACVGW3_03720, partial [Enterobacter hormaechei]